MAGLGLTASSLLPQRDCQNYIKILLPLNSSHLFTCGTGAFSPLCTYIVSVPPPLARRWLAWELPLFCHRELFPSPSPEGGVRVIVQALRSRPSHGDTL